MTESKVYILSTERARQSALAEVAKAPAGYRVTVDLPKHTDAQRKLMFSLLGQLAKKTTYHGYRLTKDELKLVFLSGLRKELRLVPSLNNDGIVNLNSVRDLNTKEIGTMIEMIEAHAATNGVTLTRTLPGYEDA